MVQSLSIVVPPFSGPVNPSRTKSGCINSCKCCVSCQHASQYTNRMDDGSPFYDLYLKDYMKRLSYARGHGCNTVMLTGSCEPQQNRRFLTTFGLLMQMMDDPFECIEMQTTGVMIDRNYLRFLRNHVGVSTISLSTFALDSEVNCDTIQCHPNLRFKTEELAKDIKEYDFTLRLSLNLTDWFNRYESNPEKLFKQCKDLGADQVTLRVLYANGDSEQAQWTRDHKISDGALNAIAAYIRLNGEKIGVLPYGAAKYDVMGMCVVLDDDCMAKDAEKRENNISKCYVLREDCKLYDSWDRKSSLVF